MATITIDPDVDEYEYALELLNVLYGRTGEDSDGEDGQGGDAAPFGTPFSLADLDLAVPVAGYTLKRMNRYVQNLTPEGQMVLRYIAQNAPKVHMDNVQNHLGKHGAEFAGTMSTFGHAINKTKGVTVLPFERHDRYYNIDPRVAEMAKSALERYSIV